MGKQIVTDPFSAGAQFSNGVAEINRIPKDDGRDDEIEARCSIALIFERAVADFAKAMKEHCPGERVARLPLIEARVRPPPQSRVADPVEGWSSPTHFVLGKRRDDASGSTAQRFLL